MDHRAAEIACRWSDALPGDWDAWVRRQEDASFAVRAGFLEALEVFPGDGAVHVLEARSPERGRRGALAVHLSRRFGRLWARSLPFGTYGGPLVDATDPDPRPVLQELARHFEEWARARRVAGGEVILGPNFSGRLEDPETPSPGLLAGVMSVTPGVTHVLPMEAGAEALYDSLKRETKKGFRKAERDGVRVRSAPDRLAAVYGAYQRQARAWGVRRPYPIPFLQRLLDHPSGFAELVVAEREGELLAGVLALSTDHETFLWWSGSTPASRETLAYPYLLWKILERETARGRRRLNIGSSGGRSTIESFKESLGAVPRSIAILHLRPHGADPIARLLQWARAMRRRA